MKIDLVKWDDKYKDELIMLCNVVDRTYLINRLLNSYTEQSANC